MLGLYGNYAQTYLTLLIIGTTVLFTIPIFFAPLTWARLMLWKIPEETDLTLYFGRCLGSMAIVIEIMMLRALLTGNGLTLAFDFMFGVFILMIGLHIYGAVQRIQPITETLEIGFWTFLLVCNAVFYPAAAFAW